MEENISEQIRENNLKNIFGFHFLASGVNKLMTVLGRKLYKWGYLNEIVDTDALTGLYNRNFYERWIEVIVAQAERAGVSLVFVVIDLNRLKLTNDKEGHRAGDRMIKRLARSLVVHARKSDAVIRMGGDEFLVVLWNCTKENAVRIMNKELVRMKKKEISFSFGAAVFEKGKGSSNAFSEADREMYEMKKKGK